jgi:hypothetical protein
VPKSRNGNGKSSIRLREIEHEYTRQLGTVIAAAFAVVVALIWKDAINTMLQRYQPDIQTIIGLEELWMVQFVYAILATLIAVGIIVITRHVLRPKK